MLIPDPDSIRDISSSLLDAEGKLKSVPARTLEQTTVQERALFGMRHAVYNFIYCGLARKTGLLSAL